MLMASGARSSTPQLLLLLYAGCVLLSMSRNAPQHLVAAANSPFSFSFDFSTISISRLQDLRLEGDAALHGKLVDLTYNSITQRIANNNCMGRMAYAHPVPFYDSITGEVSSFTTRFKFAIGLNVGGSNKEGGMAFFLSSYPSRLPPSSSGGNLGLPVDDGRSQVHGTDQFIAVEFDVFSNTWDPSGTQDHIGVDINSVRQSVNTTSLPTFSLNGSMTASITYDNSTKMLVASLQFDDRPSVGPIEVSTILPDPVTSLLPPEVAVGFSAATGTSFQLHQILSWSFNSTLSTHAGSDAQDTQIKRRRMTTGSVFTSKSGRKKYYGQLFVIFLGVMVASCWKDVARFRWENTLDFFALRTTGLRRFEYGELATMTGDFSTKLGGGAFGEVYQGSYWNDSSMEWEDLAVKKMKNTTGRDFRDELTTISETRHKNLVELIGWCCSRDFIGYWCCCFQHKVKLFLVYELVPNGDLEYHLNHFLPWEKRYKIVRGIGSAINYLHHECKQCILHRDIKPSNILLDDEFNPKLADFGLSRAADNILLVDNEFIPTVMTTAIGTVGYMDPKLMKNDKVEFNRRTDVYSFGIVLLEIACGKKPREEILRSSRTGAQFVKNIADPKLTGDFNMTQMERVVLLGLRCSHPDAKQRPLMEDAMKYVEDDKELPAITQREGHEQEQGAYATISSDKQTVMPPRARSFS
ncbi:hypothetical protein ZWY2020_015789 [Hordeum vulgare]|nr:hypothetical protein ZWY2020_015789 [Hordeum vulgare]